MKLSHSINQMIAEARQRLHAAIDERAAAELAKRVPSYRRRLGQLYRKDRNGNA